jgi:predicted DNA-binding protein (MmcQ/YjbR family)
MFCVTDAGTDVGASFKVSEDEFEAMVSREGVIPAPYLAREHWVSVLDFEWLSDVEWAIYIRQSYELVKGMLPK